MKVGDTLWYVQTQNGGRHIPSHGKEVTVETVGRKWITCSNSLRFNRANFEQNGWATEDSRYSAAGTFYPNRETYERIQLRSSAWDRLATLVRSTYVVPAHLTLEQIDAACVALGMASQPTEAERAAGVVPVRTVDENGKEIPVGDIRRYGAVGEPRRDWTSAEHDAEDEIKNSDDAS